MTGMMNLPGIESFAQIALSRVLNSLPEGLLIALCAWILLRMLGRQNAGTRFAVWLVALVGVAGLPLLSSFAMGRRALVAGHAAIGAGHAEMTCLDFGLCSLSRCGCRWRVWLLRALLLACGRWARFAGSAQRLRLLRWILFCRMFCSQPLVQESSGAFAC